MAKDPPAGPEESPSDDADETEADADPTEGDPTDDADHSEGEETADADPTEVESTEGTEAEDHVSEEDSEDPPPGETEPEEAADEQAGEKRKFRWPALRRSKEDRLVAGIAGGLGDLFRIDPVIIRVGFIVLTLFGGVGAVLYLVSWLVVPLGDSGSILANALRSGAPRRIRNLAGIVLIALGLLITAILSRNVFEVFAKVSSTAPHLALALIFAGVGLIFWPRRSAPPWTLRPSRLRHRLQIRCRPLPRRLVRSGRGRTWETNHRNPKKPGEKRDLSDVLNAGVSRPSPS